MRNILISVIIPSYNRAHIIERAIHAVLQQTYQNFELLIIDDGSTDHTQAVIGPYLKDQRICYIYQNNAGVCAARNSGAKVASGNYLIFLDSDDYVSKDWLMDFYHVICETGANIVRCRKADKNVIDTNSYQGFLAGTFTINKEIFHEVGMYDENLRFGENTELKWRIDFDNIHTVMIDKQNLFYDDTFNEGSVNKENKIHFFYYVNQKHQDYFNQNRKLSQLLYQVTGVTCLQLGRSSEGIRLLWLGYLKNPIKLKALVRTVFYCFKCCISKKNSQLKMY